jgi:hypothetical protein
MNNDLTKKPSNLPAQFEDEADALLEATQGRDKLLKFVKGKYKSGENEIPLGTQYVAHANQLTYCWIKFRDKQVVERRHGKAAEKWVPPEREELDDNDKSKWEIGLDGQPKDPWVFQHLIPFENLESGEVSIFATSSAGGQIATEELVREYAYRLKRKKSRALPIIKLSTSTFMSKKFGEVLRPNFEIDGWEDAPTGADDFGADKQSIDKDLDDQIPF